MQVRQYLASHQCADELEAIKGHPFVKHGLYWDDKVYMTPCMAYCSMIKWNDHYERFTERFKRTYESKGYYLDDLLRVRPGPDVGTVDFGELWQVLTSSDEELLESLAWVFEDQSDSKFLNMSDPPSGQTVESTGNMVAYASYIRCGNSFLRKYLENITGIATGSDMSIEFCVDLQMQQFKGEEITDSSVWIKKTHDPKWNDGNKTHKCNKVLCVARNPYDTITSVMHFLPCLIQSGQINEKFSQDIPEIWDKLLRETA